jgi:hypothetical protein
MATPNEKNKRVKEEKMTLKKFLLMAMVVGVAFMLMACFPDDGGNDGSIDETYASSGPYATTRDSVTGFTIFHPTNMDGNHPIITWGNGTAAPTPSYRPLLTHLASWGFVVIASDSTWTGSGEEMLEGVDYLIDQNGTRTSKFYGMLDTNRIGTTGHSQGGGGAINAATDPRITTTAPLEPSPGNIRDVDGPVFLVAGASANIVRTSSYVPANGPTVFGVVDGMSHVAFAWNAGDARGYLTAWFMYQLQDDDYAAEAFTGDCEICNASNWEVEMKNFP